MGAYKKYTERTLRETKGVNMDGNSRYDKNGAKMKEYANEVNKKQSETMVHSKSRQEET
jgi:hypothetical protein